MYSVLIEFGGKLIGKEKFYGSVTIGERGQVIIPAQARQDLKLEPGEKLLVLEGPMGDGLFFVKADQITKMMNKMVGHFNDMKDVIETENKKKRKGKA